MVEAHVIAEAFSGFQSSKKLNKKPLTDKEIEDELKQRELQDQHDREERSVLLAAIFPETFKPVDLFSDDSDIPDIFK